jgi:hypothetical protein
MPDTILDRDGIRFYRPAGPHTLVTAVEAISDAIRGCRNDDARWLLVNAQGMTGVPHPTLVDRFLAVEDWAEVSSGTVTVALAIHADKIHPQKFGIKVAEYFGLVANVFDAEDDAQAWLRGRMDAIR